MVKRQFDPSLLKKILLVYFAFLLLRIRRHYSRKDNAYKEYVKIHCFNALFLFCKIFTHYEHIDIFAGLFYLTYMSMSTSSNKQ